MGVITHWACSSKSLLYTKTASLDRTMRNAWTSGVDTISNLPCIFLNAILGCLPWKDAVKTSILSKDWKYKWVTRQELDFNDEFFKSFKQDEEVKRIIYQVLLVHKGPILKFRLCRITIACSTLHSVSKGLRSLLISILCVSLLI
ncbi:hypothetical protein RDI58_020550 [Solanum bulbocastanum]|uniref:Uncharacterized protein n=1 Tax=Solanum bulbocastanum TaxID=147425 RepID=A0AAN8Y7W5_SOLBU